MAKKWTVEEVLNVLSIMRMTEVESLNKLVGDCEKQMELGEMIMDPNPGPQEIAEASDRNRILREAVSMLKPREQMVIGLRYGLIDGKFHTLDECGKQFSLTRERIRQIEMRGIKKLKWIIKCKYKLKETDL